MTHKFYDVLGIPKGSSKEDIKKAYKKMAIQMHPDKGGDPEKFKEVANAYQVLSDDDKRARYDQFGDEGFAENDGGGHGFHGVDPHAIFEQFFGGGGGFPFGGMGGFGFDVHPHHAGPPRKQDHVHPFRITLEDAYKGVQKTLKVSLNKICSKCKEQCYACQGKGHVMDMRRMGFLTQMMQRACGTCNGAGFIAKGKSGCKECNGGGSFKEEHKIDLNLPAGVHHGHHCVFKGLGEQALSPGEVSGDLVFEVHVQNDPNFQRQGNDLIFTVPISLSETIVGKEVNVPHFSGAFSLNTSEFGVVQPNKPYVVKGKGMPGGNLVILFHINYPSVKLTKEDRDKIKALLESVGL
jgi:DnaJ family protein A protein 2